MAKGSTRIQSNGGAFFRDHEGVIRRRQLICDAGLEPATSNVSRLTLPVSQKREDIPRPRDHSFYLKGKRLDRARREPLWNSRRTIRRRQLLMRMLDSNQQTSIGSRLTYHWSNSRRRLAPT